jgi:hypothetical protein
VPDDITAEATGPAGAVVSFSVSAADLVDGAITPAVSPASGSTFPLGTTTVVVSAVDAAGNTAAESFKVTVVDTTAPAISGVPADILATATSSAGAVVTYADPTATDLVDGPVTVTCSPASGSTFPLGTTTVICTATDSRGNTAVRTFEVRVSYAVQVPLAPIEADGSSVFKLGRVIPVKFRLVGASAGISNAVARLSVQKLSNNVPVGEPIDASAAGDSSDGNLFRYDPGSDQYIFNWSTTGLTVGTYELRVDLGDGLLRRFTLGLK